VKFSVHNSDTITCVAVMRVQNVVELFTLFIVAVCAHPHPPQQSLNASKQEPGTEESYLVGHQLKVIYVYTECLIIICRVLENGSGHQVIRTFI
jgi:hypothetical protein